MMSASSIGAGRGGGYARYLEGKTVAPERGDYYLTPGGELAEAPGQLALGPGDAGPSRASTRPRRWMAGISSR